MEYAHYAMLLLALGLALLVAEVFIPSSGMILILAVVSLSISVWCAWHAWWEGDQLLWWSYLTALIVLLPSTVGGALYIFPRTEFGRTLLVAPQDPEELTPYSAEEEKLKQLIGKVGKTITRLNPGGLTMIDGERIHSESEGMMVDPGDSVEVIAVKGNRLVVRVATPSPETREESLADSAESSGDSPLDFEVEQS